MGSRLDRDELYISIASLFAQRSTCLRGNVGAVLVQDRRPVGAGYNGAPSRTKTCLDLGCEPLALEPEKRPPHINPETQPDAYVEWVLEHYGCQRSVHAELNAIVWAAKHGTPLAGAHMYSTHAPCQTCAQAIVAAGIERFVYSKPYRAERLDLLDKACVQVVQLGY